MKKWILRIIYAALALAPVAALADYTATQGAGSTVFAFVCSTTKICPAMVLIDSTNTEKATAGNPLRIDPTGTTTQPVSAASLPLPAGAATSANQPTNAAQASTTAAQTGTLVQGAVTTAAPTYTTGQTDPVSLTTAGAVRVDASATTQPVSGTVTANQGGAPWSQNLTQILSAAPSATNPIWTATAEATVAAGNTLNAVVANTTGTSIAVTGYGAALVNVNCSVNCTGGTTVNFQASDVVGFQAVGAMPVAGGSGMVTSVVNQAGAAMFCIPNMGYTNMRANVASYSAGTISVTITPINAASCDVAQVANALAAIANNAATIAPSASLSNSPVVGFNYVFNGTNWVQQPADSGNNLKVVLGGGSAQITASATGTTAATTATLAATAGKTTFICGFSIRANATAAATGNATVTGTITGTMNFTQWTAPLASGLGVTEETFTPCVPASATNTSIAAVSAAPGTGGVVSVSAWGYQQ